MKAIQLTGPGLEAVTMAEVDEPAAGQEMGIRAESVVKVPDHLSDLEAATLPCAGVTAWSTVVVVGQVKPGDTVLVEGTGGVALFALQFAKLAGARVAVISSSNDKLERAKALGADITVNYVETPEWGPAIKAATGGVDLVVETVGAATLPQALLTLNKGAKITAVGFLGGPQASLMLPMFIPRGVHMQGILVGGRDRFEAMVKAVAFHGLKPVINQTF